MEMGEIKGETSEVTLETAMQDAIETGRAPERLTKSVWGVEWSNRSWFSARYSFALPSRRAIEAIAAHGTIVEVGAGTGLWARILSHHTDVIATDVTAGRNSYGQQVGAWYPVRTLPGHEAVSRYAARSVLMVWPNYHDPWSHEALRAMIPGAVLCYIGEGPMGCTGCDDMHDYLDDAFEQITVVGIPQFNGINDDLRIFRKVTA